MNLFAEGGPWADHPVFQRPVPGDLPTAPGLAAEAPGPLRPGSGVSGPVVPERSGRRSGPGGQCLQRPHPGPAGAARAGAALSFPGGGYIMPGGPAQVPRSAKSPQRKVSSMRHSSYHTPSLPSRIGRALLVLLCSAGVLSGGFLLLCGLGVLSPAAISQQVSAWLHPPAASTPASAPRRTSPCRRKTTPSRGFSFPWTSWPMPRPWPTAMTGSFSP